MSKPKSAEGFEVTEYGKPHEIFDVYSVVNQIMLDKGRESPSCGVRVAFVGDMLKVYFHSYEMHLPTRMKEVESFANDSLKEAIKHIKKEYKSRTRKDLDLKEKKELANYTAQKVSLNERFYVVFWRFYELG